MKRKQQNQRLTQPPVSLSTNAYSDQNVTELKSSKLGSSSHGSNLKVATQLPSESASLHGSNKLKSKQANKKPSTSGGGGASRQGLRKTRSSVRNAVAAASNDYQITTTTTTTRNSNSSGPGVINAASAACGEDIREDGYSLSAQGITSGDNMKGVSLPLSDHRVFADSGPSLDRESVASSGLLCTGEQQQEQRQALQPVAGATRTVDVDLDGEGCTMPCSVHRESQIMGLALRSGDQTQGNVETGGPLPGLSEHSHGHNINTTANTESTDADSALSGVSSALGNPKTDSKPIRTSDSASGSCSLQSTEPATCVHNNSRESSSAEVVSLRDGAGTDLGGTESIVSGRKRGRGRGRGRKRGRGRGKKKDQNESWIRTNSQPQTCDPVGDLLEFSQSEQISSSLPERTAAQEEPGSDMVWKETSLPNMVMGPEESIPGGREKESSLRRAGPGTRASFRGRGRRRGVRGGGGRGQSGRGTMETGTIRRRVVTRSRTAALLECKMEAAEDREKMDFLSESENSNLPSSLSPPPPAKKQKQKPRHEEPATNIESKAECNGDNEETIMDISASSPANVVCGASDGVALSDAGGANSVCPEPRDSSTASALFSSAASVNLNHGGSKHTPTLTVSRSPSCEEPILSETPSLQSHARASMCTTTATIAIQAGCTGAPEDAGSPGVESSSGKPCKSSSPSPPFAQCSSSSSSSSTTATTVTSQPQAQQPSMQLVCYNFVCLCWGFV